MELILQEVSSCKRWSNQSRQVAVSWLLNGLFIWILKWKVIGPILLCVFTVGVLAGHYCVTLERVH